MALLLGIRRPLSFAAQRLHHRCFSTSLPNFKEEQKMSCMETGGNSSFIHPSAVVHPDAILGQGVSVGPFCTAGPSAKLGNGCQLYPGSHVCGHTTIGDDCTLMMGAVVGDDLPGSTVIGNNNLIGHHAVVGIKCQDLKYKVSQDVPKYTMVSGERAELRGLNLEGLRRRGFSVGEIKSLRAAYRKIFMPSEGSCHSIEDRLTELEKDDELGQVAAVCLMVESIRDSFAEDRRGICKFRFGGEGGRRRMMASSEPSGSSETPTGGSGEAHAPSWDYSWGWGSTPTSGWGYGSGSGKSPNGFARGSGFGFGSGSGSGSGYGYGSGSGGAHGGGHGSGNGNEGGDDDAGYKRG
ncbi:hypothetical protein SASPL_112869 [Salvia splendens]|uniref:UDP N-acetylglucosamine O-acyltransferase C-terminal domain-containing protein n=1 Tax=Salvia splendens TaxID=180675 RepID=A0A8X8Y9M1_SALSN|nr:hypothetical protein SASPL_112869 [Salvia splendens]